MFCWVLTLSVRVRHFISSRWQGKVQPQLADCRIVEEALGAVAEDGAEFMIASHNQPSVERAVKLMHERGLDHRTAGVFFGQLLGMADPLSFVLGANGYRVRPPSEHSVYVSIRCAVAAPSHVMLQS